MYEGCPCCCAEKSSAILTEVEGVLKCARASFSTSVNSRMPYGILNHANDLT